MPTLSVVMIVKDEEGCIADCLDSVRHIADEIIIGDTGSTDSTVEVARGFGAIVLPVQWDDDFAAARNEVLRQATGDWILHLDADEVLDAVGAERIREIVDADGDGAQGIWVTMANYSNDPLAFRWTAVDSHTHYSRGYPGYVRVELVRLFKNGMGIEYRERIHENLGESLEKTEAILREEPITIHHYGFSTDTHEPQPTVKGLNYLRLSKLKVEEHPEQHKAWLDLANAAHFCRDLGTALEAARKAVELDPSNVDGRYRLAALLLEDREYEQARKVLEAAPFGGRLSVHIDGLLGAIAYIQGRFENAVRYFESVLARQPDQMLSQLYLARTLDQLGDSQAAVLRLEETCSVFPSLSTPAERLKALKLRVEGEELFVEGHFKEALRRFVNVLQIDAEDPVAHNDAGVALAALGEPSAARCSFERALKLAPTMFSAKKNLQAV